MTKRAELPNQKNLVQHPAPLHPEIMGNRNSNSEYCSPKLIVDTRSSILPKPPHGHEYLIKSAYQSSMQPPRPPNTLGNSAAWPNSSKHTLGIIVNDEGWKIKKRIHELTFLRKE